MAKWIEWVPEMAHGIHQQLLTTAGKHSGVLWMMEPPPAGRVSCTPISMETVQHYVNEGGVPIGWVDPQGFVHTFRLQPPFEPPSFMINVSGFGDIGYEHFGLSKQLLGELYDQLCDANIELKKRVGDA